MWPSASDAARQPWVIVGNPENRRVDLFQRALARCGLPPASVLSYEGLLTSRESLRSIPDDAIIRVESPGENSSVERLLLAAGSDAAEREGSPFLSRRQVTELAEDHGRILYPRQWYLGLISSWTRWFETIRTRAGCTVTTSLRDLKNAFDKRLCHAECAAAGLPVPHRLPAVGCWDELAERLRDASMERVFIKLANGSSASGVVALHARRASVEAITTVELARAEGKLRLYNSLKVRRYSSLDDVRELVDALAPHGVHIEQWLPKATLDRRLCDLRIVVVAGEPKHMVVRASRAPITNLHLGNRRGDLSGFLQRVPRSVQQAMDDTCRRCARQFADSLHLGLDVLLTPGFRRHYLLEVNAFGDLLPEVLHRGRDTYQAQVEAMLEGRFRQDGGGEVSVAGRRP